MTFLITKSLNVPQFSRFLGNIGEAFTITIPSCQLLLLEKVKNELKALNLNVCKGVGRLETCIVSLCSVYLGERFQSPGFSGGVQQFKIKYA